MVVFGGTGDLAHRKLVPAVYNLHHQGLLPQDFAFVGVGRKQKSDDQFRNELAESINKYSSSSWDDQKWAALSPRIYYHQGDIRYADSYPALKERIEECNRANGESNNVLYYLALTPNLFTPAVESLNAHGMAQMESGWQRIMIEKPFGFDLQSARDLNYVISSAFTEENIFRIDHYLGKEMLQNILVLRLANSVFEPLWNERFISQVQIIASENEGIGDRGRYYDRFGAMRDMVQSHLLQMLALTAMEPPQEGGPEAVRAERLKLLNAVQLWPEEENRHNLVLGQYKGYKQEKDVDEHTDTETFAALKLAVNNQRWQGVPFYLRTGKKLDEKIAKIVIQFKKPPSFYYGNPLEELELDYDSLLNILTLKVQPQEGVVFQFNIKKPASTSEIVPAKMDFCQPCAFLINTPEAYERLIADAIAGDTDRFSSWDEVERAWTLIDYIYEQSKKGAQKPQLYEPGSRGPAEADKLTEKDGYQWW